MQQISENIYVILFIWAWCGAVAAYIAAGKSRSMALWFFIGFSLPVLGILLVYLLPEPSRKIEDESRKAAIDLGSLLHTGNAHIARRLYAKRL